MDIINKLRSVLKEYNIPDEFPENCNAQYISDQIGIKRNTASKHLNQLVDEGLLIKISTRPVIFLPKKDVEMKLGKDITACEYTSYQSLVEMRERDYRKEVFSNVIGFNGSLKSIVDQCVSAMTYPDGLPIMLFGESGVGKSYLAEKIYEYSRKTGLIDKNATFLELNCAQYYNNPELLTSQLFGYAKGAFTGAESDQKGMIENADGGIIFLDEIHRLSPEGQEKLFLHMDKGVFRRIGDSGSWRHSKVRYIFATTEDQENIFLETFLRRIPIICKLPNYSERSFSERKGILFHLFGTESNIVNKDIFVSESLLDSLIKLKPKGNIGEISGLVKQIIAQKYTTQYLENHIDIELLDLPKRYLDTLKNNKNFRMNLRKKYVFTNGNYVQNEREEEMNFKKMYEHFFEKIRLCHKKYESSEIELSDFKEYTNRYLSDFCDQFMYTKNVEEMAQFFLPEFQKLFQSVAPNIFIDLKGTTIQKITTFFAMRKFEDRRVTLDVLEYEALYAEISAQVPKEISIVFSILENMMDIELSEWDKLYVSICLFCELSLSPKRINAIILAHGYATASSIANVANRMAKHHIFDSIDMPLSTSPNEVVEKLIHYIELQDPQEGLLILVDMGSLSQLKSDIEEHVSVPTAIINNVSTEVALHAAIKITQNYNLNILCEELPLNSKITSQIILPKKQKKKAILVSCSTGFGTAMKIKEMLEQFLPKDMEIDILPYETKVLKQLDDSNSIFQTKEIIATIGTDDPDFNHIPFLSLEELFDGKSGNLYQVFKKNFGETLAQELDDRIVKNLSLDRLIDSLTILDAVKILEQIDECFSILESSLKYKLNTTQKINLYVHLSCMIERLVRNQPINTFPNIKQFKVEYKEDIRFIRKSLINLERLYNIEIPIEEIGYIHNILTLM
ncbi:sigma 54-interacting transcriptional regulator [Enterococcus faecium]|uniref:sigma 54-interacting transcriptional regulator n=1 Tax=Enterococcus faecium TaxID=1352 RepID=UPI0029534803|nr:sigma 54-interacting transcriptional regulator [Enterococcus faecium]MDV7748257.1 sigma 54-interacting transcriptional regulator [Enterococcus faecium]MDW3703052.1 sigma 54-interacting transcriptional regulator [Enterococcus faecium]